LEGKITVDNKKIRIRRIQLEEDPGRLIYEGATERTKVTLVDYNRAGTPLVEIVTEPDFENPHHVRNFLNILSDLLENLDVSDPGLDGAMRADANVSIEGGSKVEIKNINSFHDLEKAVHFEITRQQSLAERKIEINGVTNLKPLIYRVMFDRIEAGTYMIASAVTDGRIKIKNINPKIIKNEILVLKKMGVIITIKSKEIIVRNSRCIKKINLKTSPYPGFPTDLQAQIMVLMCRANGTSKIKENIFENRFMHIPELNRMGAKIKIKGNLAIIQGKKKLNGAELMATDLRASVSLVLAALSSKSKTIINRVYHLDRGYENIEKKLSNCGAQIKRIE